MSIHLPLSSQSPIQTSGIEDQAITVRAHHTHANPTRRTTTTSSPPNPRGIKSHQRTNNLVRATSQIEQRAPTPTITTCTTIPQIPNFSLPASKWKGRQLLLREEEEVDWVGRDLALQSL